ncbi:hypothetical protein J4Q44_G00171830, partial [Coregonus suidteri]
DIEELSTGSTLVKAPCLTPNVPSLPSSLMVSRGGLWEISLSALSRGACGHEDDPGV